MNLTRMFEDLEAQAAFEVGGKTALAQAIGESRSARVVLGAEGIGVTNLVFGNDFLLALSSRSLVAIPFGSIERLELSSVGDEPSKTLAVRLFDWLSSSTASMRMTLSFRLSGDRVIGQLLECDPRWLLVESINDAAAHLVRLKSIKLIELVPVDSFDGRCQ
jgi:hypothetical protein